VAGLMRALAALLIIAALAAIGVALVSAITGPGSRAVILGGALLHAAFMIGGVFLLGRYRAPDEE
jgi:hypothetical protein